MSTSPHKNWKGCAMCKPHKTRGGWRNRRAHRVNRQLGESRRGGRLPTGAHDAR